MGDSVFRKASLDRLSSPDQLDHLPRIINPKIGALLACLLAVSGLATWWVLATNISSAIPAVAFVAGPQDLYLANAGATGTISQVLAGPGSQVNLGDQVLHISLPGQPPHPETSSSGTTVVPSPCSGLVLDLLVNKGSSVSAGTPVARILATGRSPRQAMLYVRDSSGTLVPGLPAELLAGNGKDQRWIQATVTQVLPLPASHRNIVQTTGSEALADVLAANGPVNQVVVSLSAGTARPGEPAELLPGSICQARIILDQASPAARLFPDSSRELQP